MNAKLSLILRKRKGFQSIVAAVKPFTYRKTGLKLSICYFEANIWKLINHPVRSMGCMVPVPSICLLIIIDSERYYLVFVLRVTNSVNNVRLPSMLVYHSPLNMRKSFILWQMENGRL